MRRPALLTALLTAALLGTALPAAADGPTVQGPPTQLLTDLAETRSAELLTAAEAETDALARHAAVLEAAQQSAREAEQAQREAEQQHALQVAAEHRTAQARTDLGRYVAAAYRSGAVDASVALWSGLLDARQGGTLLRGLGDAARVGESRSRAFTALRDAEAAQQAATARALAARQQAEQAQARAEQAQTAAAQVVAEAVARRTAAQTALTDVQQQLAASQARDALVGRAEAIARSRAAVPAAALAGALVPRPGADCAGGSLRGFPNGLLPTAALCPLWGTSGQLLRADAAAAFDAMSRAHGAETGEPLCVTDSYRSYDEQVAVAAAKPTLAAVPGTSNHGWGVALDLCGGAERFGTPTHTWLVANATAYGWFLPAWAQQSGSKPEPWHWEFAG